VTEERRKKLVSNAARAQQSGATSSLDEQRIAVRRVLQMVNRFLRRQRDSLLVTDGKGLMTWGEIREHVKAAAACEFLRTKARQR
jgi:hypothetical protein